LVVVPDASFEQPPAGVHILGHHETLLKAAYPGAFLARLSDLEEKVSPEIDATFDTKTRILDKKRNQPFAVTLREGYCLAVLVQNDATYMNA
jgi:hypothetical protein